MTENEAGTPIYRPITSDRDRLPVWVLLLSGFLIAGAALYFLTNLGPVDQRGVAGPGSGSGPPPSGGVASPGASGAPSGAPVNVRAALQIVERAGCQGCHGPELEGQGMFPNLHGVSEGPVSDNLQQLGADHPDDWANLWIAGDSPEVEGIDRRGMPVFAGQLTPEEIDLIVEYLKSL
ncbi:MAG: cytochrome c [Chloroflexota bacterium]|nr:cytochrome c [Chloroflexota bacterium]